MIICLCLLFAGRASAQWVVSDPGNLAQGIINASKNIIHTSKTATNMVSNFQETVKIYQQGKKYYDALKSVNNLVKDARKVQQTILMVGDITDIYVNSFQKMMRDENFTVEELGAIAFGYTKLLEESNDVLTELKNVVNITTLSMTDKERMACEAYTISFPEEVLGDKTLAETILSLCTAQEESLVRALKEGVAKEDCESAFICAASWLAAAALESARAGGEEFSSLRAGDLTVTKRSSDEGSKRLSLLREQAWALMRPYTTDGGLCFRGVET